jgi:spermidine synthase
LPAEFDPTVYDAASRYFDLPASRAVYLEDGAAFVADAAEVARTLPSEPFHPYDYVIHDCFTGGSVPHELFTCEFWEDMRMIMKTDGVLAVVSTAKPSMTRQLGP